MNNNITQKTWDGISKGIKTRDYRSMGKKEERIKQKRKRERRKERKNCYLFNIICTFFMLTFLFIKGKGCKYSKFLLSKWTRLLLNFLNEAYGGKGGDDAVFIHNGVQAVCRLSSNEFCSFCVGWGVGDFCRTPVVPWGAWHKPSQARKGTWNTRKRLKKLNPVCLSPWTCFKCGSRNWIKTMKQLSSALKYNVDERI